MLVYATPNEIGGTTGGGQVAHHEFRAFKSLGRDVVRIGESASQTRDPFEQDEIVRGEAAALVASRREVPSLVHCYAGCLGQTVRYFQGLGCKVVYTVAAHDAAVSAAEHEGLGLDFAAMYPHLGGSALLERYSLGYRLADWVITPSTYSAGVIRAQGRRGPIKVIPHGVDCVAPSHPPPEEFCVGYLGALGPDKGVRYLLEAWRMLSYRDAVLLLAGPATASTTAIGFVETFGGGAVRLLGRVPHAATFYEQVSLYVQPSATEGFGLGILEALAHGRPVLASRHSAGPDLLDIGTTGVFCGATVTARSAEALARGIDSARRWPLAQMGAQARVFAGGYTWTKIASAYRSTWRQVSDGLGGSEGAGLLLS